MKYCVKACKEKEIEKLTDKCGDKKIARLFYDCKPNLDSYYYYYHYVRWIPFSEFGNIEYLAKGGFGKVYRATWFNGYYGEDEMKYKDIEVVLKRMYNSCDKTVDILKEVKVYYYL